MKKLFTFLCVILISQLVQANALYPVSLSEKVANSSLIIEGKVESTHSYWNTAHTFIFTCNKIKVYKIFKGVVNETYIEVITEGGTVGNQSIDASDLLTLQKEQVGVFFCFPNNINQKSPLTQKHLWDVYSSGQGFFEYDLIADKVYAPFVKYNSITKSLYPELLTMIGTNFLVKDASFSAVVKNNTTLLATPVVSNFTPETVNGGATLSPSTNVLTINGTGFGVAGGSAAVLFCDGNTGSSTPTFSVAATDNLVVSWADTQIKLRVPSRAATGSFVVRESSGVTGSSGGTLNVFYSIIGATLGGQTKEGNLMNTNGSGGYSVLYSTSNAGGGEDITTSPVLATFQRAFNTWKETVGMNWLEGGTTTTQAISPTDGTCKIMFDNTNKGVAVLGAGVLAVCYSFHAACTGGEFQKSSFDIVIRKAGVSSGSATFTNGPCFPANNQLDMEQVLLHELGHALNLAHINDTYEGSSYPQLNAGKLMHYAVLNGVKRVSPDASCYKGALYTCTPQGNNYGSCGLFDTEMTQLTYTAISNDDCPASFPATPTSTNTALNFNLTHATSNKNSDPQFTAIKCDGTSTGVTNTQFAAIRTKSTSGFLDIAVTGYTTNPADLSACSEHGVELSLYQVSSCPDGQSYPSPVACRTFNSNGGLTTITGLAANTSYLIMCDGINNTKANFTLTLTGSALPIKLSSFTGELKEKNNFLSWKLESIENINTLLIEKSDDGKNFTSIAMLTNENATKLSNGFVDNKPYTGNNFYRLCFIEKDGSKQYSNVVLIKRKDNTLISVFPNPVKGSEIKLQVSTQEKGNYVVLLRDIVGKLIYQQTFELAAGNTILSIPISNKATGVYNISLLYKNECLLTKSIYKE